MSEPLRKIERIGGSSTETHMGIKPSRKAFRAISTILYKDRVKAIIREISCNAADAHIEAGYPDKQFEVHLPTQFDPYFSVRDYGNGISKEEMETVYCTYFESSKEDKPDQTGMWGLGSKSPLCYTNSFTVTSYNGGKRYHYVIFFDEEDFPTYKLLSEEPSNSESGLEVKVPLASASDANVFADKAKEVFKYFDVKPIFFGTPINIPTPDILLSGNGWRYVRNKQKNNPYAVIAHVAYPIDVYSLPTISDEVRSLLQRPEIEIDFPNGSLTFMLGRDDLSYDKKTIRTIQEYGQKVVDDWEPAITRELDKCENDYLARIRAMEIDMAVGRSGTHKYRGTEIEYFYNLTALGYPKVEKVWTSSSGRKRRFEYTDMIDIGSKVVYCIDNTPRGLTKAKIHHYMKTNWRTVDTLYRFYVAEDDTEKLAQLKTALPHLPFKSVEELGINAPIPRASYSYGARGARSHLFLNPYEYCGRNPGRWERRFWKYRTTLPESGIYVARTNSSVEGSWTRGTYSDIDFLKSLINCGILNYTDEIYGFSKQQLKKAVTNPNWVELYDHVKNTAKKWMECYGGDVSYHTKDDLDRLRGTYEEFYNGSYITNGLSYMKHFDSHPLKTFFLECQKIHNGMNNLNLLCIKLGLIEPKSTNLVDEWASLIKKYPLFPRTRNAPRMITSSSHMKHYIMMCDELENSKAVAIANNNT